MTKRIARFVTSFLFLGGVSLLGTLPVCPRTATAAEAERKSPLADAPAIRRRTELRSGRFELGAGVGITPGQDFYTAVLAQLKLSYHFNDWLSIGAFGGFNLTPTMSTSFNDELIGKLNATKEANRAPTQQEALNGMNRIGQVVGLQAEIAPFTGKLSLFGKLFASYDIYVFGGVGFINFQSEGEACDGPKVQGKSCPVVGFKVGPNFGAGLHAFANDFVAINLEFRDIMIRHNPAGRDTTGDGYANDFDNAWDSNFMLGLNVTFFLPTIPGVTD